MEIGEFNHHNYKSTIRNVQGLKRHKSKQKEAGEGLYLKNIKTCF